MGIPFFSVEYGVQMDAIQLQLAHWIMLYEQVYELPIEERPADDVIEDDEALDEFLKQREHDITRERMDFARERGDRSAHLHEHTITNPGRASITVRPPETESAEQGVL